MARRPDSESAEGRDDRRQARQSGRDWKRDLAAYVGVCAVATALFAFTPLDIDSARLFYRPDDVNHWPLATRPPWSLLYRLAPWVTASLVVAGLAGLALGVVRRRPDWRRHATFVLASVVLGPGILVNVVFKDHWNRPRPREIVEFGGTRHYAVAPFRGEGGASFPCGHCSVGYLYAVGWWIWRRSRPRRAAASLAAGVTLGTALGVGRIAAGGHFLSDAAWSAIIALGVAHALYHHLLRIPEQEARAVASPARGEASPRRQRALAAVAALGGVAVLLAVFVTPHGTLLETRVALPSLPQSPEVLEVEARTANIEIIVVDAPLGEVSIAGELHGFGLPGSRLRGTTEFVADPLPTLRYRIEQRGWFTDLDGSAAIRLPAAGFRRVVVRVEKGDIDITDATRDGVIARGDLQIDSRTAVGRVRSMRQSTQR